MDKHKKTVYVIILVAAGLVIGLLIGFLTFGMWAGKKQSDEAKRMENIVNAVAPKPADVIQSGTAVITRISGDTLELTMNDPEDYIPHLDGTDTKKITRTGILNSQTQITFVNPIKIDTAGKMEEKTMNASDLKAGDTIYITTDKNIRTEKTFTILTAKKTVMEL